MMDLNIVLNEFCCWDSGEFIIAALFGTEWCLYRWDVAGRKVYRRRREI
jgi:hypothetical protein